MAIVLSILLAFSIDAWWDERIDRAEEREVLLGLEQEFEELVRQLNRYAARYDTFSTRMEWLLDSMPHMDVVPVARADSALWSVLWGGTFDPGSGTRDALVRSGRLELIQSRELRNRLAGWEAILDETQDNEQAMRTFVVGVVAPFLASSGAEVGRGFAIYSGTDWGAQLGDSADAAARYQDLVRDPEFRSLGQYRYGWSRASASEFAETTEEAREILGLIRRELGDNR